MGRASDGRGFGHRLKPVPPLRSRRHEWRRGTHECSSARRSATMGMKTPGLSGRRKWDSPLCPRVAKNAPWDRVGCPQFFAGSGVFEGAYATPDGRICLLLSDAGFFEVAGFEYGDCGGVDVLFQDGLEISAGVRAAIFGRSRLRGPWCGRIARFALGWPPGCGPTSALPADPARRFFWRRRVPRD